METNSVACCLYRAGASASVLNLFIYFLHTVFTIACLLFFYNVQNFWFQVELFKHPHLLLLQLRNSIFKLPGGRLRPGESGNLFSFVLFCHLLL